LVATALVGLAMCRLAARSDRLHAAALAEWIAALPDGARGVFDAERRVAYPAFDAPISAYREAS
jgi:hypothetical protein